MIISIITDRISGQTIDLVTSHIAALSLDKIGANHSKAATINMSGGFSVRCDKAEYDRVKKALENASD